MDTLNILRLPIGSTGGILRGRRVDESGLTCGQWTPELWTEARHRLEGPGCVFFFFFRFSHPIEYRYIDRYVPVVEPVVFTASSVRGELPQGHLRAWPNPRTIQGRP